MERKTTTRLTIVDSSIGASKRVLNINILLDTNLRDAGQPIAYIEVSGFGNPEWKSMMMGDQLDVYTQILNTVAKAGYRLDSLESAYVIETRLPSGVPAYRLAWPVVNSK